jgi:hypothetical protein
VDISLILSAIFLTLLSIFFIVLIIGTILRKGKLGINFQVVNCVSCGNPSPRSRAPKSIMEALWGGWTCEKCGTQMDKWGNKR